MCVYSDCVFSCLSKAKHHSLYANIRRGCKKEKEKVKVKSNKVNWDVAEKLGVKNEFIKLEMLKKMKC